MVDKRRQRRKQHTKTCGCGPNQVCPKASVNFERMLADPSNKTLTLTVGDKDMCAVLTPEDEQWIMTQMTQFRADATLEAKKLNQPIQKVLESIIQPGETYRLQLLAMYVLKELAKEETAKKISTLSHSTEKKVETDLM